MTESELESFKNERKRLENDLNEERENFAKLLLGGLGEKMKQDLENGLPSDIRPKKKNKLKDNFNKLFFN